MAITRPVTKTIISTVAFGVPVVDEVNSLRDWVTANTPTAWTAVTFQNGWLNLNAVDYPISYRKRGDMVDVRGAMKPGTMGAPAFTLPVGFRPAMITRAVCAGQYGGTFMNARVDVLPDGSVNPLASGTVDLFGMLFSFSTLPA